MVDAARPADHPDPLPAGPRQALLLPEARQRHVRRRTSSTSRSRRRTARSQDYLYFDDVRGPARLRADGDDRIPRLGQPRSTSVEKPDRLVFDLDPDVGLDFGKVKKAAVRLRGAARRPGPEDLPAADRRQGHPRRRRRSTQTADWPDGQDLRRALQPRHRRGRAGDASPPTSARPSARAASSSTGCATSAARPRSCLIRPAPAKARRSPRRSPGRSWTSIKGGNAFTIRDADQLLEARQLEAARGLGRGEAGAAERLATDRALTIWSSHWNSRRHSWIARITTPLKRIRAM